MAIRTGLTEKQWKKLFEAIERERCILCLGPEVFASDTGETLEQQLASYLREDAAELKIQVYDDSWFHYLPGAVRIDALEAVDEFFRQPFPVAETIVQQLAQVPFHLYLNFNPDYKLREAFDAQQLLYEYAAYLKHEPHDPESLIVRHSPSRDRPILYNMVGEINERNSLVMTYDDFYSYLESIYEQDHMLPNVRFSIQEEAEHFLFLGMPFDRWYIHFFMRILKQHEPRVKKLALNAFINTQVAIHAEEQYTLTFVTSDVHSFVAELLDRWTAHGETRQAAAVYQLVLQQDRLQQYLETNDFKALFTELEEALTAAELPSEWPNQLSVIRSEYNQLRKEEIEGLLTNEQATVRRNQLRRRLLDLLDALKNTFGTTP